MGMSAGKEGSAINVTPLIDILLVLLIIFLVMLPIMMKRETVEIPPKNPDVISDPVVVLRVNADFTVTVDDADTMSATDLPARIGDRVRRSGGAFVDFSEGVPWGEVLHTVDLLRGMSDDPANPDAIRVAVRMHPDPE
jgi:biopolymer transport protein ExbD